MGMWEDVRNTLETADGPKRLIDANKMACKAIEKRIQKEPIHKLSKKGVVFLLCPTCGEIVGNIIGGAAIGKSYKFCPGCGQAMKHGGRP